MNKLYTEDSIQSLSPREFTRLRPGVYAGSTEYSTQLLIEIVSNAIDEWTVGHGDLIKVNINDDGSCRVEDFAQGFPVNSIREDGETVLQASFDVLNTSGKFTEDGVYSGTALGLNGIGGKLVNFLTLWTEVTTYRDGQSEFIQFEDGIFKQRKLGKQGNYHTGTIVAWKPDPQFFTNPQIEIERIKKLFNILSCLCPGLTIELTLNDSEEIITYYSESGLHKLMDEIVSDKEILKNRLSINETIDEKNKINFIFSYADTYALNMSAYVNTGATDSGPHITQIKTIITREFNKFFKEKKWLKDKDSNLSGEDLQEGMVIMFNITAPGVSYDAQTKSRIVKIDMSPFSSIVADKIQFWLNKNEKDIKEIFDKAISARKAREAAKKARETIRKADNKKRTNLNLPTKLVDSWSKDRSKCELLIAEGDSAVAGLIGARDSETQACFPVRGKVINCFKNSEEKIFANQEVINIIKAIGLDLDEKTKKLKYDETKLRYGKVILCCDAKRLAV